MTNEQQPADQGDTSRHVEVLRAMGSVFKSIPSPCEERDAIEAAIAALSQPKGDSLESSMKDLRIEQFKTRLGHCEDALAKRDAQVAALSLPRQSEAVGFSRPDALEELASGLVACIQVGKYSEHHRRTVPLYTTPQPAQADTTPAAHGVDSEERCESGDPECGPVEFHDVEGVPLCRVCWEGLVADSNSQAASAPGGE